MTVSRSDRAMPAARTAPNDDPYSTIRCSPRCHHTRCGISCTSGCDPVAIDERQTGVSDGKVDVARRYVPCSARNLIAGVSAASNIDGVRPSMTTRTTGFNRARGRAALRGGRVTGGASVRRAEALRAPPDSRGRARTRAPHRRATTRPSSTAVPPRVPPRRSAPVTIGPAPSVPQAAPTSPPTASLHPKTRKPTTAAIAPATTSAGSVRASAATVATPIDVPSPTRIPIEYQPPIDPECSGGSLSDRPLREGVTNPVKLEDSCRQAMPSPCSSSSRPRSPVRPGGWRASSRTSRGRSVTGYA